MPWPAVARYYFLNRLHDRGRCYSGKSHILQNRIRFLQMDVLNRGNRLSGTGTNMHQVGIEPMAQRYFGDRGLGQGTLLYDLGLEGLGACTALSRYETLQKVA